MVASSSRSSSACAFVQKLHQLINDPKAKDHIWWSEDGESFIFKHNQQFAGLLRKHFRLTKTPSLIRQLNSYHFYVINSTRRTNTKQERVSHFKHPHFKRERWELLSKISKNEGIEDQEDDSTALQHHSNFQETTHHDAQPGLSSSIHSSTVDFKSEDVLYDNTSPSENSSDSSPADSPPALTSDSISREYTSTPYNCSFEPESEEYRKLWASPPRSAQSLDGGYDNTLASYSDDSFNLLHPDLTGGTSYNHYAPSSLQGTSPSLSSRSFPPSPPSQPSESYQSNFSWPTYYPPGVTIATSDYDSELGGGFHPPLFEEYTNEPCFFRGDASYYNNTQPSALETPYPVYYN